VHALALEPEPVPLDEIGLDADALEHALDRGAAAVILTPAGRTPPAPRSTPAAPRSCAPCSPATGTSC
jgi:hypothetical protein